ncbi:chromate efflux transporter [Roseovarius autotrophicus]|uniref:chromate efflux transporter n=1 Tax=Roseovarius autotrophicus TaxID=2824121 RepID=UPI001A0BA453|nr:chromate efflux transporter [Roseovarius autotrophicus]MBE0454440.1 chromate efflux transporter [Roseovarius sp.]
MDAPAFSDFFRSFARIGLLSFGGPAAQISVMHDELVTRRGWLSEPKFLGALSFCMLLPGPEAMQLATYAGWRLRGVAGGIVAGLLFVVPGASVILGLGLGYAVWGGVPLVQAVFLGIKAAVVAIVIQALLKLAKKALSSPAHWVLAGLAFVAMFVFSVPFPAIIATAALWGWWQSRWAEAGPMPDALTVRPAETLRTALIWAALWAAPVVVAWAMGASFLIDLALFFSKLAVVTFGGAYAVLAYMTDTVVGTKGWLTTAQMIDALGLAETTPGPLILVTQFVGLLAGYVQGGVVLGITAALLTLWVTFVPCFLWIFTGAPYVEHILARPRLKGALAGVSAAVVGVILNLSVWFALHVVFIEIRDDALLPVPVWASFSWPGAGFTALAVALLVGARLSMGWVLTVMAGLAGGWHLVL